MNEQKLVERLQLIEALHARAGTAGEKEAAASALERIQERLAEKIDGDEPIEYSFSMRSVWNKKLFLALLERYGIEHYRYRRQRRTTVMAMVSQRFVDEVLWPEYEALSEELSKYLSDVTDRVIEGAFGQKKVEERVRSEPAQIPHSG